MSLQRAAKELAGSTKYTSMLSVVTRSFPMCPCIFLFFQVFEGVFLHREANQILGTVAYICRHWDNWKAESPEVHEIAKLQT